MMFFKANSPARIKITDHPVIYSHLLERLKTYKNEHFDDFRREMRKIRFEKHALNSRQQKSIQASLKTTFTKQLLAEYCIWSSHDKKLDHIQLPHLYKTKQLLDYISNSNYNSFSELFYDLKQSNNNLFFIYQAFQLELFPELRFDKKIIFETLEAQNQPINTTIPPQFKTHIESIKKVKGTPTSNLLGPIISYGIGFAPYILGGIVAGKMTNLTEFARLTLAAAPTGLGGGLRFWVAHKTDLGQGKRAVMTLLSIGLSGLLGLFSVLFSIKPERLATTKANEHLYWIILFFNFLSGAGVANYSASLPNSARAAPNDSPAIWREHLHSIANIHPTSLGTAASWILRKGPAAYMGIVAGIGSLTPSITLISSAFLLPEIGLYGVYAIFGAITLTGTLGTYALLQDSILDQLRNDGVSEIEAKDIASWMGQKLQSDPHMTYLQRLKQLDSHQKQALGVACFNYITTFGILLASTSTASLTLSRRGMDPKTATLYAASISGISSAVRALMSVPNFPVTSATITSISMATMTIASLFFALSKHQSIWLPMLIIFSIGNGAGNYGVFAQISDTLSDIVGLASGLAGGIGACTAFLISIAFASIASMNETTGTIKNDIEQTDHAKEYLLATAFCFLSLIVNLVHTYAEQKRQNVSINNEPTLHRAALQEDSFNQHSVLNL